MLNSKTETTNTWLTVEPLRERLNSKLKPNPPALEQMYYIRRKKNQYLSVLLVETVLAYPIPMYLYYFTEHIEYLMRCTVWAFWLKLLNDACLLLPWYLKSFQF